ncbi:MAG: hypothetical protein ABII12_12280 [Planctomycetota bacterium]
MIEESGLSRPAYCAFQSSMPSKGPAYKNPVGVGSTHRQCGGSHQGALISRPTSSLPHIEFIRADHDKDDHQASEYCLSAYRNRQFSASQPDGQHDSSTQIDRDRPSEAEANESFRSVSPVIQPGRRRYLQAVYWRFTVNPLS